MGGWLLGSIAGIPAFLVYVICGAALLAVFGAIYVQLTPHHEARLIREGNVAAAVGYGGTLVGFSIPLARAIQQASSIPDLVIWAVMALIVQFLIYLVVQWLLIPDISGRIERGDLATGVTLAAASIAGGMINSASMTL